MMMNIRLLIILIISLVTLLAFLLGLGWAADFQEMQLANQGQAYELNRSPDGQLWLSDYGAGQAWQVNPATNVYTIYSGIGGVTDAQVNPDGDLLWLDFDTNTLGYLPEGQSEASIWPLGGLKTASGLAIDGNGAVWISHINASLAQRFVLTSTELCNFNFPPSFDSYTSWYIAADQKVIWLAGWNSIPLGRIFQLDPEALMMTGWGPLPVGSNPLGLAVDADHNVWWADSGLQELGRLNPGLAEITRYSVPLSPTNPIRKSSNKAIDLGQGLNALTSSPTSVEVVGQHVWFTDFAADRFGVLAPGLAAGQPISATANMLAVSANCSVLGAGSPEQVNIEEGNTVTWSPGTAPIVLDEAGWTIYQLPDLARPWGMAATPGNIWLVEQERRQLGWLSYPACFVLSLHHNGSGGDPQPEPANSPECGLGQYVPGQAITLTAAPDVGWGVADWSGTSAGGSQAETNTLLMPANDQAISVDYGLCFQLQSTHTGTGTDPVTNPTNSFGCPPGFFAAGAQITVTAAPAAEWFVSGWSGTNDDAATTLTNQIAMPEAPHTVSVHYGRGYRVFLPGIQR